KIFIFLLLLSVSAFAQYYEEPAYGNFEFQLDKIEDKNTIAKELTNYLKAQNPEKLNFKLAEKAIALSLYLDGFNMDTVVLNASLKHNLALKRNNPYSTLEISALLEKRIEKDLFSDDRDKVIFAAYLSDIHKELNGEEKYASAILQLNKVGAKAGWDKILKNYSVAKLNIPSQSGNVKVGRITKTIHPDYATKKKGVHARQATSNGLMVSTNSQGVNTGIMSEVIGTVMPASGKTTFSFTRQVGTSMEESLISAEKALKARFPNLEDGYKVNVSFSNKFSNKDGDSAGTAITVMLFSMFEGLEIDKSVAMTGTISEDWKVGIVGGVASKIRGALKGNCKFVGVPYDNREAVQDLVILYGIENLWKIQVFSLSTLDQAIDLARVDKSPNLQKATDLFTRTTAIIPKNMRFYNGDNKRKVLSSLKSVLTLAPNHLSARVLYNVISGNSYLRLSFLTSVEEVNRLSADILSDEKIPDEKVKETLKTLAIYAKRVDRRVAPYADQIGTFLNSFMKLEEMAKELNEKFKNGVRDEKLYNLFLGQKDNFTTNRDLLIRYAKNIDKDVEKYFEEMRKKHSD
ncbi:MAG: hypothetical protein NE327_03765, partial [Lentisphaeraceae bacterium]|nr:hypothetical protein [Lentisphaeraceae bacterium]